MVLDDDNKEDDDIERYLHSPDQWPNFNGFKPLDPSLRQIRLLRISFEPVTRTIHGSIFHASLDNQPQYEALSYYWGPPDYQKAIQIDGQPVLIRKSLHSFLVALCNSKQSMPVWLDSLCIDQRNVDERNSQVSMMGEIYRSAVRVKAWVGDGDPDSDYIFGYMKSRQDPRLINSPHYETVKKRARKSLGHMINHPYWRRVWIVQETAFAKELLIYCGHVIMSWVTLLQAGNDLVHLDNMSFLPEDIVAKGWDRVRKLASMQRAAKVSTKPATSLWEIVHNLRYLECEDSKDKIYGFLSLASEKSCPVVDYSRSLAATFFEVFFSSFAIKLDSQLVTMLHQEVANGKQHPTIPRYAFLDEWAIIKEHLDQANEIYSSLGLTAQDIAMFLDETGHDKPTNTMMKPPNSPMRKPNLQDVEPVKYTCTADMVWTTLVSAQQQCYVHIGRPRDRWFLFPHAPSMDHVIDMLLNDVQVTFSTQGSGPQGYCDAAKLKPSLIFGQDEWWRNWRTSHFA